MRPNHNEKSAWALIAIEELNTINAVYEIAYVLYVSESVECFRKNSW